LDEINYFIEEEIIEQIKSGNTFFDSKLDVHVKVSFFVKKQWGNKFILKIVQSFLYLNNIELDRKQLW